MTDAEIRTEQATQSAADVESKAGQAVQNAADVESKAEQAVQNAADIESKAGQAVQGLTDAAGMAEQAMPKMEDVENIAGQAIQNLAGAAGVKIPGDLKSLKNISVNPKAILLNKINGYLNIAIGTVTGAFTGNAWSVVRGFIRDPEYYLSRPGHWYMGLIRSGIMAAVVIFGINFAKKILREKLGIDLDGGAGSDSDLSLKSLSKLVGSKKD